MAADSPLAMPYWDVLFRLLHDPQRVGKPVIHAHFGCWDVPIHSSAFSAAIKAIGAVRTKNQTRSRHVKSSRLPRTSLEAISSDTRMNPVITPARANKSIATNMPCGGCFEAIRILMHAK